MMKPYVTDTLIESLCTLAKNGCKLSGRPSQGGVPFFEMRGTETDLAAVIEESHGAVKLIEVSVPPRSGVMTPTICENLISHRCGPTWGGVCSSGRWCSRSEWCGALSYRHPAFDQYSNNHNGVCDGGADLDCETETARRCGPAHRGVCRSGRWCSDVGWCGGPNNRFPPWDQYSDNSNGACTEALFGKQTLEP